MIFLLIIIFLNLLIVNRETVYVVSDSNRPNISSSHSTQFSKTILFKNFLELTSAKQYNNRLNIYNRTPALINSNMEPSFEVSHTDNSLLVKDGFHTELEFTHLLCQIFIFFNIIFLSWLGGNILFHPWSWLVLSYSPQWRWRSTLPILWCFTHNTSN